MMKPLFSRVVIFVAIIAVILFLLDAATGVIEIFYDLSAEKKNLHDLINRSTWMMFGLAFVLLAAAIVFTIKTEKIMRGRSSMKAALIESEKRYRALFENAGDAIFILEAEGERAGRIADVNQAGAKMHGYTIEELKAMKITDLDTPEFAQSAPGLIRRILSGEWVKTELMHKKRDGTVFPMEVSAGLLELGDHKYILAIDRDITERRRIEQGREKLIHELQEALEKIKTLRGMLPICASCKKIRDDKGYWNQIEAYVRDHTEAEFSHGICPECVAKLYPGIGYKEEEGRNK